MNAENSGKGAGRSRRDEVKEVSKKEIDDKIKATLARLSGGGKKKRQKIRRDNRDDKREKQEQEVLSNVETTLKLTEFISVKNLTDLPYCIWSYTLCSSRNVLLFHSSIIYHIGVGPDLPVQVLDADDAGVCRAYRHFLHPEST